VAALLSVLLLSGDTMQYFRVLFDNGESLIQETYAGQVLRYCDMLGNAVTPPQGGAQSLGPMTPSFPIPPDPMPVVEAPPPAEVVVPDTPAAPSIPSYDEITGAPLRVMSYDDKGQLIRIDYPGSGTYQMLDYAEGRLRKITQVSTAGVGFERHFYYDYWGRFCEETQL
jgi:hypothetical protein